ncbi:MAG: hypothetical protein IJ563_11000 [Selenomonadaceae bacterium]|nr:hypothetical protein [Selenomonadaceae bacterium]MBR1860152.1 hypothetical protein [Selenomonadaceae bacterium]
MYDFFKLIYHIEFFLVPISFGFLSYAMINGKNKKPYVMAVISSIIMFIISFIGVYINDTPEHRESMRTSLYRTLNVDE